MTLHDNGAFWSVSVSAGDTYRWATKPGASWPCSTLRNRRFWAQFDKGGNLVDLTVNGRPDNGTVDGHEFNALLADLVKPKAEARGWALNC